jgi:hypothetical protein
LHGKKKEEAAKQVAALMKELTPKAAIDFETEGKKPSRATGDELGEKTAKIRFVGFEDMAKTIQDSLGSSADKDREIQQAADVKRTADGIDQLNPKMEEIKQRLDRHLDRQAVATFG